MGEENIIDGITSLFVGDNLLPGLGILVFGIIIGFVYKWRKGY